MAWQSLQGRLNGLPIILAGPILRHTESQSVTVWAVLKAARTVTLKIYDDSLLQPLFSGSRHTVALGAHVHMVAVTARAPVNSELEPGQLYFYDLELSGGGSINEDSLESMGLAELSYAQQAPRQLPSFVLPPSDLNNLRLLHGSCRRTSSTGHDALEAAHFMLEADWDNADRRPHQIFLTGDQIYADEVPSVLLHMLSDASKVLVGGGQWSETLDIGLGQQVEPGFLENYKPGSRRELVLEYAKFSTKDGNGHLLALGEFLAMYMFVWSTALWPALDQDLPTFAEVQPEGQKEDSFNVQREHVIDFKRTLDHIRKAMANTPTYMVFDDHEVTDDWYLSREWCVDVVGTPLGRRILLNSLLAYAVCQAWGNTPEVYDEASSTPGKALLDAATAWIAGEMNPATALAFEREVAHRVGVPHAADEIQAFQDDVREQPIGKFRHADPPVSGPRAWQSKTLDWHFTRHWQRHEVIALDPRTWRGFEGGPAEPPIQISDDGMKRQLTSSTAPPSELTLILAPTNIMAVPLFHAGEKWYIQFIWRIATHIGSFKRSDGFARPYDPDLADSWEGQNDAFEKLLARLAARSKNLDNSRRQSHVIVLTGDVHFGWVGRLQYATQHPYRTPLDADDPFTAATPALGPADMVMGQFTVSGVDNQVDLWQTLHRMGFVPGDGFPVPQFWLGWTESDPNLPDPDLSSINIDEIASWEDGISFRPWMFERIPHMVRLENNLPNDFQPAPHWHYRMDYIRGEKIKNLPALTVINAGSSHNISTFSDAMRNHREYADRGIEGTEINGNNNFGELLLHWEASTTLTASLAPDQASFDVADATDFPAPPFYVRVDDELIEVGEVNGTTFSTLRRGRDGTLETLHSTNSPVALRRQAVQNTWWRSKDSDPLEPATRFFVSLDLHDPGYPMQVESE